MLIYFLTGFSILHNYSGEHFYKLSEPFQLTMFLDAEGFIGYLCEEPIEKAKSRKDGN
jgi:hypothetical protein